MKRILIIITILINGTNAILSQSCVLLGDFVKLYETCSAKKYTTIYGNNREDGLPLPVFGEDNATFGYYVECNILKIKNKRACIEMNIVGISPENIFKLNKCWVSIENLGICYKIDKLKCQFPDNNCIILYGAPSEESKIIRLNIAPSVFIAHIINTHNLWFKVNVAINDSRAVGWLSPNNQCVEIFNRCMGN